MHIFLTLWRDEAGFVVSAELVLISTIAVLAMVVGLSEVSLATHRELNDVAGAYGVMNAGYRYQGLTGESGTANSAGLQNPADFCDGANTITGTAPTGENHSN